MTSGLEMPPLIGQRLLGALTKKAARSSDTRLRKRAVRADQR